MRSWYILFPMDGKRRLIYKSGTLKWSIIVMYTRCLSSLRPHSKSTKEENLLKNHLGIFQPCWYQREVYGSRSQIYNQTREGMHCQAQGKKLGHVSGALYGENTWMLHGPRNSMEEFKLLSEYSEKYAAQWPHTNYRSSNKSNKLDKKVSFKLII